jgi:DNA-binding SARP family transcriptional activator
VLTLSFLGPFRAELDGQSLLPFRTTKVQALLIYLVAEHTFSGTSMFRRESLMELLWAETPEYAARNRFSYVPSSGKSRVVKASLLPTLRAGAG